MSFATLPREIHDRIISYLSSSKDVAALSVQCRALNSACDMAARGKYHKIVVFPTDESFELVFNLLMDILRRPHLGRYVRRIESCDSPPSGESYPPREYQRDLNDKDMHLLRAVVRKAGFTGDQEEPMVNMLMQKTAHSEMTLKWPGDTEIRRGFITQALATVLIVLSPNLVSLATTPPSYQLPPLDQLLSLVNANPDHKPYLQNLRKVYIFNRGRSYIEDGRFYEDIDFGACMAMVGNLPSIEWIGTDVLEESESGEAAREFPDERSSNINRIAINHSSVDTIYLARAILSCKVLREIQYTTGGRAKLDGSTPEINPITFLQSIYTHRKTLEIIDLDVEAHIYNFYIEDEDEAMYPDRFSQDGRPNHEIEDAEDRLGRSDPLLWTRAVSLKDFVQLKRLSLGIGLLLYLANGVDGDSEQKREAFMLVDCLPDSLEFLCIRGYEKGESKVYDRQITALLDSKDSKLPKLKEIIGIEECIPHADDVEADGGEQWQLEDADYLSD